MAQLWLNDGRWPNSDGEVAELMAESYAIEGRTVLFPGFGRDYGYTMPLMSNDPVDPSTANFQGLNAQCFRHSPEHDAVIVSMGTGGSCGPEWTNSRAAIVSNTHPLFNSTFHKTDKGPALPATAAEKAAHEANWRAELAEWWPVVAQNSSVLPPVHLEAYKRQLELLGMDPLPKEHAAT